MNDELLERVDQLIQRADLDGLVRLVDEMTSERRWAELLVTRDRARRAVSSGRQLWPVATLAEYRLALHGPARWAAEVLGEDSGRFTIGPLSEVVAQSLTVTELAAFLSDPVRLGFVAHERALRVPREAASIDVPINPLEIPLSMASWEPSYALATYTDDGCLAPSPPLPDDSAERHADDLPGDVVDDPEVTLAVRQLFDGWTASSGGRVEVICVEGTAGAAVRALGVGRARLTPITLAEAMGLAGLGRSERRGQRSPPRRGDGPVWGVVVARRTVRPPRRVASGRGTARPRCDRAVLVLVGCR